MFSVALVGLALDENMGQPVNNLAVQPAMSPSMSPSPTPIDSPLPSPSPSALPQISPRHFIPAPSPTPTPTPKTLTKTEATVAPQADSSSNKPQIEFINLPESITGGDQLNIQWKISGPAGAKGDKSTLVINFEAKNSGGGSSSSVTNKSRQSYGPFTVPVTYSSKLNMSGPTGPISLQVTADVNGQTVTAERSVQLLGN